MTKRAVESTKDSTSQPIGRQDQLVFLERPHCRLPHRDNHELLQADAAERRRSLEEGLLS